MNSFTDEVGLFLVIGLVNHSANEFDQLFDVFSLLLSDFFVLGFVRLEFLLDFDMLFKEVPEILIDLFLAVSFVFDHLGVVFFLHDFLFFLFIKLEPSILFFKAFV